MLVEDCRALEKEFSGAVLNRQRSVGLFEIISEITQLYNPFLLITTC